MDYIAYYRTSTEEQALGIKAQRRVVREFVKHRGKLVGEFEEHESGAKDRPVLNQALQKAKDKGATLVVARLDRLSRSTLAIFKLRARSGVNIIVVENPTLFDNALTLAVYAGMAEHERELISKRTKSALAELKAQGIKLGNPNGFSGAARQSSLDKRRTNSKKQNAVNDELIYAYKRRGLTDKQIAELLISKGVKTPKGGEIYKSYVRRRVWCIRNGESTVKWT